MTPLDMVNRLVLHDDRIFYFVRFAYGMKDVGPLFLVSSSTSLNLIFYKKKLKKQQADKYTFIKYTNL